MARAALVAEPPSGGMDFALVVPSLPAPCRGAQQGLCLPVASLADAHSC